MMKEDYIYKWDDIVYFYNEDDNDVVKLKIVGYLSGWSSNDWEYYECENEDGYRFEISQHDLRKTYDEAKEVAISFNRKKMDEWATRLNRWLKYPPHNP